MASLARQRQLQSTEVQTSTDAGPPISNMAPSIRSRPRARTAWRWLFALLVTVIGQQGIAQSFNEYQVKAVFLFNFAQFVEWPSPAAASNLPFVIGVLGDDPFDGFLDEIVQGELVNNRPFVVRRYRHGEEIADCHILFVGRSAAEQLPKVLASLKGRHILTVGDVNDFASRGGIVQFVTENKRVRLKINVNAAKAANISISSKLLRPAEIVSSESG